MSTTEPHHHETGPLTESSGDNARAEASAKAYGNFEDDCPPIQWSPTQGSLKDNELILIEEIQNLASRLHQIELQLTKETTDILIKVTDTSSTLILWLGGITILQACGLGWFILLTNH